MTQQNHRSSATLLTTSLLAGLIGLTTIGCTNVPTTAVPQPTPSKSSASIEAPRSTIPVTKGEVAPAEPSVVNPTVPATTVASTIRDGRYWVGGTDRGLEIQGDRYRYDTEGGEQPWRSSTELQPVKDGVIFDGKAHWCLSTMAPKSGVTACSETGWITGEQVAPPIAPDPEVAAVPERQQTQPATTDYPEITEGMSYGTFRRSAAEQGWKPSRSSNCTANVDPGSALCEQLPELQSCDQNFCQVVFNRVRTGKLITLKVFGGNNDQNATGRDSKWRVISWSIDHDNSQP
jgi:hypothetical protein